MKIFSIILLQLLVFTGHVHGQETNYNEGQMATTTEIYNYVTKGLEIQLKSGLDMKRGYYLWDKISRAIGSPGSRTTFEYKALIFESTQKVCAWVVVFKQNGVIVKYFCIPTQSSRKEVWEKCFIDLRDSNLESDSYLAFTWSMMNLIGQLTNNYGEVCFPKESNVLTTNGYKSIEALTCLDTIVTFNERTSKFTKHRIKELVVHSNKSYPIYRIGLTPKNQLYASSSKLVSTESNFLEATANHPIHTIRGRKKFIQLAIGDELYGINSENEPTLYVVTKTKDDVRSADTVYNLILEDGKSFVVDGIMVLVK